MLQLDALYLLGAALVWSGALAQIIRLYRRKKSRDISVIYIGFLTLAHVLMLPRAVDSDLWVWMTCRAVSLGLCAILLTMVIHYKLRENKNEKCRFTRPPEEE